MSGVPSVSDGSQNENSPWMTAREAARYLRIALGTLRNWTSARYVPHVRRRRIVRYHRAELDRWLLAKACRAGPHSPTQSPVANASGSATALGVSGVSSLLEAENAYGNPGNRTIDNRIRTRTQSK